MSLATNPGFFKLLADSHSRLLGRSLMPEGADADWLYLQAPFAVLAHDTAPDPCFIYANRAAQHCFGYSFEEFVGMPSRLSAEAPDRAERARLLETVARDRFVTGYAGLRIAKDGRHFRITDGAIWQLIDSEGNDHGQAASFPLPANK